MKKFAILAAFALLAACDATPEEQDYDMRQVQNQLPEGCEIHYAGSVRTEGSRYASKVFYTTCGKVTTTSESHTEPSGKTTRLESSANVSINQP